jgi:cysteine desulfurase
MMGSESNGTIYLDYNATTPVDPRVLEEMLPYLRDHFGNPSSSHVYGTEPRRAIALARRRLAGLLDAEPDEVVFTAGGTESDALAIHGVVRASGRKVPHIITQRTEHPAVLETLRSLERRGSVRVTYLPVDENGRVSPAELAASIAPHTVLVSIMYANNETGTIQPIGELASIAHEHGVLFHTDAAQGVGKVPISVRDLGVDLLSVAGHKMYAPKGVGVLYMRRGVVLEPLIPGGGQEGGLRSGTENVAAIAGLGMAAALASEAVATEATRLREFRDLLFERLRELLPGPVVLNGDPRDRLPNTLNVSLLGAASGEVLDVAARVAASTGSACHSGQAASSPVLEAMGVSAERAMGVIRLSLGRWTTRDEVESAAGAIAEAARSLRDREMTESATGVSTRTDVHGA